MKKLKWFVIGLVVVIVLIYVFYIIFLNEAKYQDGYFYLENSKISIDISPELTFKIINDSVHKCNEAEFSDLNRDLKLLIYIAPPMTFADLKESVQKEAKDFHVNEMKNDLVVEEMKGLDNVTYFFRATDKNDFNDLDKENFKYMIEGGKAFNDGSAMHFVILYENETKDLANTIFDAILNSTITNYRKYSAQYCI